MDKQAETVKRLQAALNETTPLASRTDAHEQAHAEAKLRLLTALAQTECVPLSETPCLHIVVHDKAIESIQLATRLRLQAALAGIEHKPNLNDYTR